jgi:hypothetical protein
MTVSEQLALGAKQRGLEMVESLDQFLHGLSSLV